MIAIDPLILVAIAVGSFGLGLAVASKLLERQGPSVDR